MNKNDKNSFAELMAALSLSTSKEVSKEKIDLYFNFLKDLSIKDIKMAIENIVRTDQYSAFPTIGKIRSFIEGEDEEKLEHEANAAWSKVCKLAWNVCDEWEKSGDYMLDESIRIAFGSWKHFGETDPNFEGPDRKHFLSCYKGIARREKRNQLQSGDIKKELIENRKKLIKSKATEKDNV